MPLPLFFHLVVILRKKLELVKLALSALPAPDSQLPHSSSRRLAPDLLFPPSLVQLLKRVGVVFVLVSG